MHARELAGLVDLWRREPGATVSFIADPNRSDLAMLDPRARELTRSYQWDFPEMPLMGGVRPSAAQLFTLRPPGWMLGPGWAVTAEVGGKTALLGGGPLQNPARLAVNAFSVRQLRGFGLMQRDRAFASYEDAEARYRAIARERTALCNATEDDRV